MKKLRILITGIALGVALIAAMAVSMFACSPARTAAASEADIVKSRQIEQMLAERLYKVDFTRAYPVSGPSFTLNYPYYVSVIGERVESFLPYFGRAYNVPYGGGEGLRFDAPISGYSVKTGRKGQQIIDFEARTAEDRYTFQLEVYPTGEAYLTVSSMNRQSISFNGDIDMEPEFEAVRVE